MSVWLGFLIAIIAYAMLNIGNALQKKGASELPPIEDTSGKDNIKNFLKSKTWLIGWIMATVQWYIFLIALTMAPVSLLTPLMGVGLVILVIFSYFYLKEPIGKFEILGIIVIIFGVVILGINTTGDDASFTLDEVNVIFGAWDAILFTIVVLVAAGGLMGYSKLKNYKNADICYGIGSGLLLGIGTIYSKAFMAGITGSTFIGTISSFAWWLYFILIIIGNMGNMVTLQVGFQKGKAVVVSPLNAVFNVMISVLGGVIIFSEWDGLDQTVIIWNIIALIAILIGVVVLSFLTTKDEPKTQEQQKPEVEDVSIDN